MFAEVKEGRGTSHVSQACPKRPKQSMEIKGQGVEMKKKRGASRQLQGGPGLGKERRGGLGLMAMGASTCGPLC